MSRVPPGGEGAAEHRSRDVVEGPAGSGAERHDPRQNAEIYPRLGTDQHSFERRDEIGIAEILRDQLGDATSPRLADVKDVACYRSEQRPVSGEDRFVTTDHHCHRRRTPADRRIEHVDISRAANLGDPTRHRRRIRRRVDQGAIRLQSGQDTGRRIERRELNLAGAGQRCENHLAQPRNRARAVRRARAPRAERRCRFGSNIVDSQLVAGLDQTAGHRRTHRPRADKAQLHLPIPP
jgi:hypothetical protein